MNLVGLLEVLGSILQFITPFYTLPLDDIQTILDTAEDLGLAWRDVPSSTIARRVLEYVPPSLSSSSSSSSSPALLILLHGFNGSPGTMFTAGVPQFRGFLDYADTSDGDLVILAPEAWNIPLPYTTIPIPTLRSWNDYGHAWLRPTFVDDVSFVADDLVAWAVMEYNIDTDRVFCAGVSGGGTLVHRLLRERSHVFAAAAPLITLLPRDDPPANSLGKNTPYTPTPILTLAGTKDPYFNFHGGFSFFYNGRSFTDTLSYLAEQNGVSTSSATTTTMELSPSCAIDQMIYRPTTDSATAASAPVEAYVVQKGGHFVPGTSLYFFYRPIHPLLFGPVRCETEFDGLAVLVAFFEQHGL